MSRIIDVTARYWEPWRCELVTSPLAVGSLGVKSVLPYRSLFYLASLGLLGGPFGAIFGPIWAVLVPSWAVLECSYPSRPSWKYIVALLMPYWGHFGPSGGILEAFGRLGAFLGASWGGLGSLLGCLGRCEDQKSEYATNA